MGDRHLVTTKAGVRLCPRCHQPMIVGVSEGRTVRCDPYPIAKNIEVAAIIAGRVTYTWHLGMLQRRPPILTGPVLANHVCGKILPHVAPPPSPPPCYVPPF